jgi:hypothetical protein
MSLEDAHQRLAEAIIEDCSTTLNDDYNFYRRKQSDGCNCYTVLHKGARTKPEDAEEVLVVIETLLRQKRCKHRWTRSHIDEAIWVLIDAKAAAAEEAKQ